MRLGLVSLSFALLVMSGGAFAKAAAPDHRAAAHRGRAPIHKVRVTRHRTRRVAHRATNEGERVRLAKAAYAHELARETGRRNTRSRRAATARHARRIAHHHRTRAQAVDRYTSAVHPIGRREIGEAAWYGGPFVGLRTASGARLDRVHPTAAHRSLPLNSLARVTNLRNGRSVIVRVNDRGPVNHRFVIDLSPRAASDLKMKQAGVVRVAVQPVQAFASQRP